MKLSAVVFPLFPFAALASSIQVRADGAAATIIPKIDLSSLVSGYPLEYSNGIYSIFALDDNQTDETQDDSSTPATKKLSFPAKDGKLTLRDGSGALIGSVTPDSQGSFAIQLDGAWAANPTANSTPKITSAKGPLAALQKRAPKTKATMKSRVGRYSPGMGGDAQIYADLVEAIADWVIYKWGSKREDSGSSQLLMPVFVLGPGVTFEAVLGLQQVVYQGPAITSAVAGDLMIDIDNALDFEDCKLCLLPVSNM